MAEMVDQDIGESNGIGWEVAEHMDANGHFYAHVKAAVTPSHKTLDDAKEMGNRFLATMLAELEDLSNA